MARNVDGFWAELLPLARAVGRAMGVTLRNLWRKPVTIMYPDTPRPYPDRFRGVLALTYDPETGEENCIGCRLCEYICPPQVIAVEMLKGAKRNYAKTFTLELYACEFCELCVQVCPTDAIVMLKTFDLATADRRDMLLDKDRLHALGRQWEPSWATGNKLRDMQAPPKPAKAEAPPPRPAKAEAPPSSVVKADPVAADAVAVAAKADAAAADVQATPATGPATTAKTDAAPAGEATEKVDAKESTE